MNPVDWISDGARIPLGKWVKELISFLQDYFGWLFDFFAMLFSAIYDATGWVLTEPPAWAIIIVLAGISYFAKGWRLALGTVIGLVLIIMVNQWENAMLTLALTIVAVVIATLIAIPLGIWAARSRTVSNIVRPVLDFLQTMPAFVYLLPAIFLFSVGPVPGIFATIMFAVAPGVRLTELGIRGVDAEVVEAGNAFGATPGRILRQIQLPLAMPSIMAGVNQVIMLSLSMVVIAGMVGAGGLGGQVVQSLTRIDVALGFEAGLSVVILAVILDRVTGAFGGGGLLKRRAPKAKRADASKATDLSDTDDSGLAVKHSAVKHPTSV